MTRFGSIGPYSSIWSKGLLCTALHEHCSEWSCTSMLWDRCGFLVHHASLRTPEASSFPSTHDVCHSMHGRFLCKGRGCSAVPTIGKVVGSTSSAVHFHKCAAPSTYSFRAIMPDNAPLASSIGPHCYGPCYQRWTGVAWASLLLVGFPFEQRIQGLLLCLQSLTQRGTMQ